MAFKLNGWRRLWVVLCLLYLLAVAGITWSMYPKLQISPVDADYLSEDSRQLVVLPDAKGWTEIVPRAVGVRLPNGQTIEFRPGVSDQKIAQVSREYWRVVEARVQGERLQFLGIVGAVWLVPCIALYAAGTAVAWVVAGFRAK